MATARRGALVALLLLPGALAVYTAFHGGGFFAGTQGKVALLLALILLLRFTVADNPFGGASAAKAMSKVRFGPFHDLWCAAWASGA